LLLRLGPTWDRPLWHQTLAVFATLYMVCAILRLARFNVESQPEVSGKKGFTGLPSPAAAGCIASLAILKGNLGQRFPALDATRVNEFIEVWAMLGSIFVALLMVSKVPYPKMTKRVLTGRRHFDHLILLVIGGFILAVAIEIAPALIFWGYVFAILGQVVWVRASHRELEAVPELEQ
jgi:CDP-diacylglycerol---serine O-phosphatidyltransferase